MRRKRLRQSLASGEYGWWVTDDGKLFSVNRAMNEREATTEGHRGGAIKALRARNISLDDPETKRFLRTFNESDFVMKYLGWIRLQADGDVLQVEGWGKRVARGAFNTLRRFINENDQFTDYALEIRSDDPKVQQIFKDFDSGAVKAMLGTMQRNLVTQVMPQTAVQAAKRRLEAWSRLQAEGRYVRPPSLTAYNKELAGPLSEGLARTIARFPRKQRQQMRQVRQAGQRR